MDILLRTVLFGYKKTELYLFAKQLGLVKVSRLTKAELVDAVYACLLNPDLIRKCLFEISEQDFQDYFDCLEGREVHVNSGYEVGNKIIHFCYGVINDQSLLTIPQEIKRIVFDMDMSILKRERKSRDWFCKCIEFAFDLYGVIPDDILLKLYNSRPENHISELELLAIYQSVCADHKDYIYESGIYLLNNQLSKEDLRKLLERQKGKQFYIPSWQEIRDYAINGFLSNNRAYTALSEFFDTGLNLSKTAKGDILQEIWNRNSKEESIVNTIKWVCNRIELPDSEHCIELVKFITSTYNHTRMQGHRGYTSSELVRHQPFLQNLITVMGESEYISILQELIPFFREKGKEIILPESEEESIRVIQPQGFGFKKIYPNEPCYCGSGKKYKKCCGKK